ncbi:STN domain-containing protein [Bradyrhizobium cenepequi]
MLLALGLIFATDRISAQDSLRFDIRPQPLAKALYAFSQTTGIEVMVDARQVAGRQAPEVSGSMPPLMALSMLLAGSNLAAHEFAPGTVAIGEILKAVEPSVEDLHYYADVQRAIEHALCSDPRTLPGHYRLALRLWVGQSGEVTRSKRLDTTGDDARDGALDAMIARIRIEKPPPPHFPQPIALIVSPVATAAATDCSGGAPAPRRAANP